MGTLAVIADLETGSEALYDGMDFAADLQQEKQRRNETIYNFGFANRYVKGVAHILVRLRDRVGSEFIACFQSFDPRIVANNQVLMNCVANWADERALRKEISFLAWSHSAANWYCRHRDQHAVLINDVQLVELPDYMAVPSLVWLDTVESFEARLAKAHYASSRSGLIVFGLIGNWERSLFHVERSACRLSQSSSEVIERASQIMDGIPEFHREFGINYRNILDVIDDAARFEVALSSDYVGVIAPEFENCGFKVLDVLIGPLVLCQDSTVSIHEGSVLICKSETGLLLT